MFFSSFCNHASTRDNFKVFSEKLTDLSDMPRLIFIFILRFFLVSYLIFKAEKCSARHFHIASGSQTLGTKSSFGHQNEPCQLHQVCILQVSNNGNKADARGGGGGGGGYFKKVGWRCVAPFSKCSPYL